MARRKAKKAARAARAAEQTACNGQVDGRADVGEDTDPANARQVGGSHYKSTADDEAEQHWDRTWRLWGPGYFVGQITKYVERYRRKDGVQDLRKAAHFLQKLIELEEADGTLDWKGEMNE